MEASPHRVAPRHYRTRDAYPIPSGGRLIYVDQLRALALVAVFLGHVCEVFSPFDNWHITNPERSRLAGEVTVIVAPWVMPLFMLLAGVSAWYSLKGRTNSAFIRERFGRIFIPLFFGVALLVPPQVYLERRLHGQFTGSFWAFLPHFFDGIYPRGNFSWHHLWFLGHLFVYSLVLLPVFRHLQQPAGRAQLRRLATFCGGRGGLIWLAVPLILERQLLWGLFPERHMLTSDWSNHALLLVTFGYGFVLAGEPRLGEAIDRQWPSALILAGCGTVLLVASTWTWQLPWHVPPPYSLRYLTLWTLYAVVAWAWMVAVLGAGRRWLNRENALLRYARHNGYAWYLLHQPIIVAVAFAVVQTRLSIALKFGTILIVSLAGTIVGAELVGRLPLIGRLLGSRSGNVAALRIAPRRQHA